MTVAETVESPTATESQAVMSDSWTDVGSHHYVRGTSHIIIIIIIIDLQDL